MTPDLTADTTDDTSALTPVESFKAGRERLAKAFAETHDPDLYLRAHAALLDETLIALARRAGLPETNLALAAVGGYGRRELYPYSDIDVLVLTTDEARDALDEKLGAFVTSLWELGLPVGASVRTESEYAAEAAKNVTVATTYLESRLLMGDAALYERSRETFFSELSAEDFFRDKMLERARRHQRFEDTPYSLEPNLKESPGGLRDLQVFLWCAQAAGLAQSVPEMASEGLITERERDTLLQCGAFLARLRIELHLETRRHEDRLLFDVQEPLAQRMGIRPTAALRASEVLMKRYYRNAQAVVQMSVLQLQAIADRLQGGNARATPVRLEAAFIARGDEMDVVGDDVYKSDPNAILRTFLVFLSHPELTRLSTRLLRALWLASFSINDQYRSDPKNQETFLSILKMKRGTYHALKLMNIWGVLGRFLEPFRHIVGQMQHDLYHIFTVDQHTLRTVRNVRRFGRSDFAHEYPFCSQVMSEIPESWRVSVAALFHDIGKGLGGRHEEIGAEKVRRFCVDYGFPQEDTDFIVFLVREHLTMSRIAQREDISDPAVIERFVKLTGRKDRLDALYLLTVADIRATSPKVWTQWKAQLLETLYRAARARLTGETAEATVSHTLERRKEEACALIGNRVSTEARERFWEELDVVYFMRHRPDDIAWHTEELAGLPPDAPTLVRAKRAEKMGGLSVLLSLPDRKGVFLQAVAFLSKSGLSVVDARIHTTADGRALDTFLVTDTFERFTEEADLRQLERAFAAAMAPDAPPIKPRQGKLPRRARHFPTRPSVSILPSESGRAFILNITCTDRLGLLYAISDVLAHYGVNLQTAKLNTLDERAEDVFLIDGEALQNDETLLALEAELLEAVKAPTA